MNDTFALTRMQLEWWGTIRGGWDTLILLAVIKIKLLASTGSGDKNL